MPACDGRVCRWQPDQRGGAMSQPTSGDDRKPKPIIIILDDV
jgi:hypothetical protein